MTAQDISTLAALTRDVQHQAGAAGRPFWLGIAGAPGSGKSTLAEQLAAGVNLSAIVIPMDGYHFSREQLDQMPDPHEAHARRGAPFTFDGQRFVHDLNTARQTGVGMFPAFAHGIGDPVEDAITLTSDHQLVIVEGNYLLLPTAPWNGLEDVFEETWFLDVPLDVCCDRLLARHRSVGRTDTEARHRIISNDRPNAELVISSCPQRADRCICVPDADPSDNTPRT